MNRSFATLALLVLCTGISVPARAVIDSQDPSSREPSGQVLGFYSKGSLHRASAISKDGRGFIHLFQARDRGWGSEGLIQLLERGASDFADLFPEGERLQIGDIAAENGGFISGHASHQTGLDADVVYFHRDHREQDPTHLDGFEEKFVLKGRVTANLDLERNLRFIELLAASGRINRIFMDPAIKSALCQLARTQNRLEELTEVLRRLRPLQNHDDHMHFRLTCPAASSACEVQEEVPPGSGC